MFIGSAPGPDVISKLLWLCCAEIKHSDWLIGAFDKILKVFGQLFGWLILYSANRWSYFGHIFFVVNGQRLNNISLYYSYAILNFFMTSAPSFSALNKLGGWTDKILLIRDTLGLSPIESKNLFLEPMSWTTFRLASYPNLE